MEYTMIIIAVAALIIAFVMKFFTKPSGYKITGVDEFAELISQKGVQLMDVRTKGEFSTGHLKGAILVDVTSGDFKEKAMEKMDKSRPVAVYCHSGSRSNAAAGILGKEGYDVTSLRGGIISWSRAGKKIV